MPKHIKIKHESIYFQLNIKLSRRNTEFLTVLDNKLLLKSQQQMWDIPQGVSSRGV